MEITWRSIYQRADPRLTAHDSAFASVLSRCYLGAISVLSGCYLGAGSVLARGNLCICNLF